MPPPARPTGPRVFGVSFLAMLAVLLLRSRELFWRVVYEEGDLAANSIITYQAKHFDLLVGNYSRLGFAHPGPAYFYLQAAGEWLLHDLTGLVPSPWNGQAVAILALNSACVALTLAVLSSWFRSPAAIAAAAGAAAGYLAANGELVTSTWMPYAYFAPFLLLLVAGASVAAGRTRHLWPLAFAGSLLVHGHAEFLFFVPLLAAAALLAHRPEPGSRTRRDRLLALGVVGIFALPIGLNLALHWPGEFGRYLAYGGDRGVHPPAEALRYLLRFWGPNTHLALAVAIGLFAGVRLLARLARDRPHGRLLRAGARLTGLATLLFLGYAGYGIDDLREVYLGYFTHAVPLALILLGAAGSVAMLAGTAGFGPRLARTVGVAGLALGLVAAGVSPDLVNRRAEVPGVPAALDAMAARARGRPMVLELSGGAWPEAVPLVVGGLRRGQRVCLRDPHWRVLVTARFVCTTRDLVTGERFVVGRSGHIPSGAVVLADVFPSVVATVR